MERMCDQRFRFRPWTSILLIAIVGMFPQFVYGNGESGVDRCRQNSSDTRLIDNGYEGLVVWLGNEVAEDYNLIRDLQKLLSDTSEMMFKVTRKRAYIRKVSVFLPKSWGKPPPELEDIMHSNQDVVHHSHSKGDFLIKNRSPRSSNEPATWRPGDEEAHVDRPYVIKPTPCGYSGQYLRFSPEFVRFGERASDQLGSPEKLLMREWAKLRWGVYDEIPLAGQPNFYPHTDLGVNPVACSLAIEGKKINSVDPNESCAPRDALENPNCEFEPEGSNADQRNAKKTPKDTLNGKQYASLMYRPDLGYVNHFCDSEEESNENVPFEQQHNAEAPTIHNLHCQGRSVWDVMRNHPDFIDGENPPLPDDFVLPAPQFTLLQVPDRRIVLVLDTSTSMGLYKRMKLMRQAASQFIETVPLNSWIGIVCFSSDASVKSELLEIDSNDVRNRLKNRLPTVVITGTSIGSGIRSALNVLKTSGPKHMRSSGGTLLVLTDGKEHNSPKINETFQEVMDFGVQVDTIAFGPHVTSDLERLAELTGGNTHFASSGDFSSDSELREAFLATIENDEDDVVVISSRAIKILQNTTRMHAFEVDNTIGVETRITILYTDSVPPRVGIRNPAGQSLWENGESDRDTNITAEFYSDGNFSTKSIQYYGEMEPGKWKILVRNEKAISPIKVQISILSRPRVENEAIALSPALLCRIIDYTGVESIVIYAYLSLGESAVLNAFVGAEVTRPLSSNGMVDTAYVQLRDDGRGADIIADDGIYSGYFTSFTLEGRYNVKVFADNSDGRAETKANYILGIGYRKYDFAVVNTIDLSEPTKGEEAAKSRTRRAADPGFLPSFQRSSSGAGAFTVNDWQADVCPEGYNHFQDSCYKFVRSPPLSHSQATALCQKEGGDLAHVNTNQELLYLFDVVDFWDAWFGGIDKRFRESDDFTVDYITTKRSRRGSEDEDLAAIAKLFQEGSLNEDLQQAVASFEPDLKGLGRKELNKILRNFGLHSVSEIEPMKEKKLSNHKNPDTTENPSMRRRREAEIDAPFGGSGDPPAQPTSAAAILHSGTTSAIAQTDVVTLALAKKKPEKAEFENSGEPEPVCSWFRNSKIIETSGDHCSRAKNFVCERPKLDLLAPSRITDLTAKLIKELGIITADWTAPGDDYTSGTATRYEMRTLRTRKAKTILLRDFEQGELLTQSSVTIGTFENPRRAGKREMLYVNVTEVSGCPPHAALDLIVALPRRFFDRKSLLQSQQEAGVELFRTIFSIFKISKYEIQVSIVAVGDSSAYVILRDANDAARVIRALEAGLESENVPSQEKEGKIEATIQKLTRGGRIGVPKALLSIIDEEALSNHESLKNEPGVMTIAIGVGISDKASELRSLVSKPTCRNAILVDSWQELNSTADLLAAQLCYSRETEYQAIGIIAVDDQGLKGTPSNIVPLIIENPREDVICQPEDQTVLPMVAGIPALTVGLAVGIPLAAILSIVGAIILFGQLRKYRKKKKERRERKEMEAKREAAESARAGTLKDTRPSGNLRALLHSARQNPLKIKANKTSPVTSPPV